MEKVKRIVFGIAIAVGFLMVAVQQYHEPKHW